jgi:nicotinate-nucleotide--dimethylbenzimidazole phosphoribosyltransferase
MTKIAISLAAVLLLILAIGYFAMRFLRADDNDDFDDLPAEPARPRGRAGDQDWGQDGRAAAPMSRSGRGGRSHPDADVPAAEPHQASRGRSGRPSAARRDRDFPDRDLQDRDLQDRGYPDSAFPDPSLQDASSPGHRGTGRPGSTRHGGSRDTGTRDTGTRDTGTRDTGTRDTGSRDTGSRDTGSRDTGTRDTGTRDTGTRDTTRPARGRNSREYAASPPARAARQAPDDRDYGDRRFSFNPPGADDQRSGGTPRAAAPAGARGWAATDAESTQLLGSEIRADQGRSHPGRADQSRADQSRADQTGADQTRAGQDRRDAGRPAGRPASSTRSARAKRGGEMSGKDWDSLSDVDYWAELASDKPLTTMAQPAGPASRAEPDFAADPPTPGARSDRRGRASRADAAALADGPTIRSEPTVAGDVTAVLPARRHAPADPAAAPLLPGGQGSRGDRARLAGQPERGGPPGRARGAGRPASPGAGSRRSRDLPATPYGDTRDPDGGIAALARLGAPSTGGGRPPVLDDDPLTSPSFPAIRDEDSRSYRSQRPEAPSAGSHASGNQASGNQASGNQASGNQASGSHASGRQGPGGQGPGSRGSDRPGSGSYPAGDVQRAAAGYPAASADPVAGYDTRPAARGRRARPDDYPDDYAGGYGQPPGRAAAAGPDAYPTPTVPAAPASVPSYRDYADLSTLSAGTPPGNPYGSYVGPAGTTPPTARPDSDAYGGYGSGQETQRYSQPTGRHLAPAPGPAPSAHLSLAPGHTSLGQAPLGYPGPAQSAAGRAAAPGYPAGDHLLANGPAAGYPVPASVGGSNVVPIHAAPVPAGPEPAAGDYGSSWYGAPSVTVPSHDPASARYGPPAAEGYPGGSYPTGGYGGADYPAAPYSGSLYDQSAHLPAEPSGSQQDQNGYGTPDSGYGAGTSGGYPGY